MNLPTRAETHSSKIIRRLEVDIFPWMGDRAIAEITAQEVLKVLRRIESRGTLTTEGHGRLQRNVRRQVGPTSPLFFVRPGELRRAPWAEFNFDKAEWRYFVTKTKTEHLVPLASQAVAILLDLRALTGHGAHVFPGRDPKQPMSEAAVNAALRRMGYDTKTEITGHGFRAMARTILHEELEQKPEVIEHQLAHKVPAPLGSAYNRTKFLKERKAMMQLWADYLDKLKSGAEIIQMTTA